jgi:hypothetical protein
MDIVDKLRDLHKQATTERSHYYVAATSLEALHTIEHLRGCLRMIRNHWNEFGPEHGFEDALELACAPIDINKGAGSTWAGLPKK